MHGNQYNSFNRGAAHGTGTDTMTAPARPVDGLQPTLKISEAAEYLGISRASAYRLAALDDLPVPVLRIGNSYRVPTVPLLELLGLANPTPGVDGAALQSEEAGQASAASVEAMQDQAVHTPAAARARVVDCAAGPRLTTAARDGECYGRDGVQTVRLHRGGGRIRRPTAPPLARAEVPEAGA